VCEARRSAEISGRQRRLVDLLAPLRRGFFMVGRNKCDRGRPGCRFATHHRKIFCSLHTLCPAEDYGDNLSEGEPREPSDVHHAATIRWGWGPMQDMVERAALVAAARSGVENSASQARAEGGGGFLRVGQKRQLAFHAGVLSARRRAIPFVSRIRAGEIRRKHDLIAHGAAALTRRTEKNDKGKFGQS